MLILVHYGQKSYSRFTVPRDQNLHLCSFLQRKAKREPASTESGLILRACQGILTCTQSASAAWTPPVPALAQVSIASQVLYTAVLIMIPEEEGWLLLLAFDV